MSAKVAEAGRLTVTNSTQLRQTLPRRYTLTLPAESVIRSLRQALEQDSRVKAAWLKGSFARVGDADRHSDIDLHVWLSPGDAEPFRQGLGAWLAAVRPVLLCHELFGGYMVVSLLQGENAQVVALDVFIETDDEAKVTQGKVYILLDREGQLKQVPFEPPDTTSLHRDLEVEASYFWRLFAMLPSIERDELIPAVMRLSQEVAQVVNVCTLGRGRPRDVGEKRANELLEPDERLELERVLVLPELTQAALVAAHVELAQIMRRRGRLAAQQLNAPYPEALEQAVLNYVRYELVRMGLAES